MGFYITLLHTHAAQLWTLQLHHKIKMARYLGDFVQGAYGEVSVTLMIRNPKTFQVRHISVQSPNTNSPCRNNKN